jgi:hypothetical protein
MFFGAKNSYCVNQLGRSKIDILGNSQAHFPLKNSFFILKGGRRTRGQV